MADGGCLRPRHAFGPCGQVANENKIFNHILDPVGPAYTTVDDEKLVPNSRSKKQLRVRSLDLDQVDMKGERIPRSRLLQSCKKLLKVKDFERISGPCFHNTNFAKLSFGMFNISIKFYFTICTNCIREC